MSDSLFRTLSFHLCLCMLHDIYVYIHIYIYIYIHAYVYIYMHIYIYIHTSCIHICMCIYLYIYMYISHARTRTHIYETSVVWAAESPMQRMTRKGGVAIHGLYDSVGAAVASSPLMRCVSVWWSVLQRVAVFFGECTWCRCFYAPHEVCYIVLQCVVVCSRVLPCVAVCCSVLHRLGVCCGALPRVTVYRSGSTRRCCILTTREVLLSSSLSIFFSLSYTHTASLFFSFDMC